MKDMDGQWVRGSQGVVRGVRSIDASIPPELGCITLLAHPPGEANPGALQILFSKRVHSLEVGGGAGRVPLACWVFWRQPHSEAV